MTPSGIPQAMAESITRDAIAEHRAKIGRDAAVRIARQEFAKAGINSCQACGWAPPDLPGFEDAGLEMHHIRPVNRGGQHTNENLALLCACCHRLAHRCFPARGIPRMSRLNFIERVRDVAAACRRYT